MTKHPREVSDRSAAQLVRMVMRHATHTPDAIALVSADQRISYGALLERAQAQGCRVRRLALRDDVAIAVTADRTVGVITLILGCLLEGRAVLLIPPTLPAATRDRMITATHAIMLSPCGPVEAVSSAPPSDIPPDTAFLLTTSGSTGDPKVVPLPGPGIDRFVAWAGAYFDLAPATTVLSYAPLSFDLSLLEVWAALAHGCQVVLTDQARALDGAYLRRLICQHAVHVVQAVPLFYQLVLDAAADGPSATLPSVRSAVVTGDSIAAHRLLQLSALFPRAGLYNVYGCTETNNSFVFQVDDQVPHPAGLPLGDPLPDTAAFILGEDGQVLTGAGSGELFVSTPFQAHHYHGAGPEDDRFARHSRAGDNDERIYFRTGDMVERCHDGRLVLLGRNRFHVKVRGTRVNLETVERVLLNEPEIIEAVVIDVAGGLAGRELHAIVRRRAGSSLNSLQIRQMCAQLLSPAAVPSRFHITEGDLPRTSTGKVDRAVLAAPDPGRVPDHDRST